MRKVYRRKRRVTKKVSKPVAKAVRTIVKRQLAHNIELKHISTQAGPNAVSDVVGVFPASSLPIIGTNLNERIGDTIRIKSFNFKYTVYCSDPSNVMRVIIFQSKENSLLTGVPLSTYLLQTPGTYPWLSQLNQDTKQTYHVLYDVTHTMQNGGPLQITRSVNINKFAITKLVLPQPATTTNNCLKGEIYIALMSDSNIVVHPTFLWKCQLRYTDA